MTAHSANGRCVGDALSDVLTREIPREKTRLEEVGVCWAAVTYLLDHQRRVVTALTAIVADVATDNGRR